MFVGLDGGTRLTAAVDCDQYGHATVVRLYWGEGSWLVHSTPHGSEPCQKALPEICNRCADAQCRRYEDYMCTKHAKVKVASKVRKAAKRAMA